MIAPPEFSRTVRIDTLGPAPRPMSIVANADECAALARRFDLIAVDGLGAEAMLALAGGTVTAIGMLRARVTQSCVATGTPVEAQIEEAFRVLFRSEPSGPGGEDEIELSEDECDVVFHAGSSIDLGEAVAETLSLSLDPYPRAPDADAILREAGVKSEAEAGPFGALAALRDKLTK